MTAILFGLLLVAELLFFPETLYPRKLMLSRLPTTGADDDITTVDDMPRSRTLPWLNFWKVPGVEHPKPWDAVLQFGRVWTLPNVAVAVFFYCFAWSVPPALHPALLRLESYFLPGEGLTEA